MTMFVMELFTTVLEKKKKESNAQLAWWLIGKMHRFVEWNIVASAALICDSGQPAENLC